MSVFALAAAVVLAIVLPSRTPSAPDLVSEPLVLRSIDGLSPATPVSPVDQTLALRAGDELLLSWVSRDPATLVRVEVLNADGEIIWASAETEQTEIAWPVDTAQEPGRYYWWVVVADSPTGRRFSELASFELVDEGVIANLP